MSTPKTIMIVEDEMIISLHMEDTLGQAGHKVVAATTVQEANRLLDAGGIDFAVLDYHVTDGDTDPLMLRLHEMGVQFLVCSGLPARDDAETLFGDAPVLSKPFSTEGLLEAITALMGVRQSDDLQ